MKKDVFISYSRKDSSIANELCLALDRAGMSYFIDKTEIHGGEEFMQVIAENILACKSIVFLCSANSYASDYTAMEVAFAIKKKISILPYLIDDSEMPPNLELAFSTLNKRRMSNFAIDSFVEEIRHRIEETAGNGISVFNITDLLMDEIKQKFVANYNQAIKQLNSKEVFSSMFFFQSFRPAIEQFCKIMVYNCIEDRNDVESLLHGKKSIEEISPNKYAVADVETDMPQNSLLINLFVRSGYIRSQSLPTKRERKEARAIFEYFANHLRIWFSLGSENACHDGKINIDLHTQSFACILNFTANVDLLKGKNVLSEETVSLLESLEKPEEASVSQEDIDKALELIDRITAQSKKTEEKLIEAEKAIATYEKALAEANSRAEELEKRNRFLEEEKAKLMATKPEEVVEDNVPEPTKTISVAISESKDRLLTRLRNNWDVEEEDLDDDQLDIIEDTIDQSMVILGCAGSGKSVIAVHKAEQFANHGSVILIAYTITLNDFMQHGREHNIDEYPYRYYYKEEWERAGCPSADYIVVDEIQDFKEEEIRRFIGAAKKHYLFLGDLAQKLYSDFGRELTEEKLYDLTHIKPIYLHNNYRLPRKVARITQDYVGLAKEVKKYSEKNYHNEGNEMPHIIHFDSFESQFKKITELIASNEGRTIGILLPSKNEIIPLRDALREKKIPFEYRCSEGNTKRSILHFNTLKPKLTTYHSAKGLQFDLVILPSYSGAASDAKRRALYVAMTRTMSSLYILYYTSELEKPLSEVPKHLYLEE